MTPTATAERMETEREQQPVRKRWPAPSCPECASANTLVTHTEPMLRRFHCNDCGHRWKKCREVDSQ